MKPRDNISVATIAYYMDGRMAMSHLFEQGYRKIGHISGPLEWWEARQRKEAWNDVLTEHGLAPDERHCVEGNWSSASGALAIEKLFDQFPEMDAIFVANDQMALSVLQFFAEKKVRIPEDVGIVGFDNIAESAFFSPALTTVQQDQHKVANLAVAEVIKIIESGWQGLDPVNRKSIVLAPSLIVRHSSSHIQEGGELQGSLQLDGSTH
jgi:LacI family transcriptional regulator